MWPGGGWSGSYTDKKSPSGREREKWVTVGHERRVVERRRYGQGQ
jgi:hypothetical protein